MNVHAKEDRMLQDLDKLLKLQVIDYDLGELERSKEYLPDMMDNLKREMTEAQIKFESATSDLEDGKIRQKNLELDISSKEADLQKYQQQMMSIKTNKEYDALVSEIDNIKGNISNFETELLETIDLISNIEKNITEYEEKYNLVKDNSTKQLEILQEKIDSIGDKVAAKDSERIALSSSIPRQLISIYERVRRGKGGSAVVAVKKRACGACYKGQTPKKIQDIRKGDRIFTCDNCGRLLYWDDNESL